VIEPLIPTQRSREEINVRDTNHARTASKGRVDVRIKRLLAVAIMAFATISFIPSTASAQCYDNTGNDTVDNKVIGDTCSSCGYLKVRGKVIYDFPCGP
jgi:hypothetical protein